MGVERDPWRLPDDFKALLDEHLGFYQDLATGARLARTPGQRHFIEALRYRQAANTDHEQAFRHWREVWVASLPGVLSDQPSRQHRQVSGKPRFRSRVSDATAVAWLEELVVRGEVRDRFAADLVRQAYGSPDLSEAQLAWAHWFVMENAPQDWYSAHSA